MKHDDEMPESKATEGSILSTMMLDEERAQQCAHQVRREWFYSQSNATVFQTICSMLERGLSVDLVTLCEELNRTGTLDKIGGAAHLSNLCDFLNASANLAYQIETLRTTYVRRQFLKSFFDHHQKAMDRTVPIADTLYKMELELKRFQDELVADASLGVTYHEAALSAMATLETGSLRSLLTGHAGLDEATGGFRAGELVIYTAETGVGKTLLAQQTARYSCHTNQMHGLFVSAEMKAEHLMLREIASRTGIPIMALRRPKRLANEDFTTILNSMDYYCNTCRIFEERPDMASIYRSASEQKKRGELEWLVLDYDELMEVPGAEDEMERLAYVGTHAKMYASVLNVPVILISQLRKIPAQTKKPSTTAGAGSPLQRAYGAQAKVKAASFVICVDRKYARTLNPDDIREANLIVWKSRDGFLGGLPSRFDISSATFSSVDTDPLAL